MKSKTSRSANSEKARSMGMSQIHNFSNHNQTMKSRTQYATPYTLSPPPQPSTRQQFPNTTRNKVIQNDKFYNGDGQNYQKPQIGTKRNKEKRQFVSMDELLGYLTYINNEPGDAFKADVIPLQEISQHNKSKAIRKTTNGSKAPDFGRKTSTQTLSATQRTPALNIHSSVKTLTGDNLQQQGSQQGSSITDTKKKLNKNRAIKRIIQTAFDLLQKNYHYTDSQLTSLDNQRSTSTQFNIYLKQYNRIIEQIHSKQQQQQMKFNTLEDENEDSLQQVFEYTVMDDFRQNISVMFTKQKVSKTNVNIMITAFRQALVMLKSNQMRVEFSNSDQPIKTFKMSEIQNVQYFTHPYIFIVLTINKDKTKSKQHLYMKFTSEENLNKWDRALYCCYMSRKMNKKEKLFQIEFPVEDVMKKQKEEFKKQDQQYIFNDDELHIVDRVFRQVPDTHSLATNYPTYDMDGGQRMISDRSEYMNLTKNRNLTQQKITISIHNPDNVDDGSRRLNTVQNKSSKYDNPFKSTGREWEDVQNHNQPMGDSMMSFGQMKMTNSVNINPADQSNQLQQSFTNNPKQSKKDNLNNVFLQQAQSQQGANNYDQQPTFNRDHNQQHTPQNDSSYNYNNNSNNIRNTSPPSQSPTPNLQSPLAKSSNPFMRLLKVAEPSQQQQQRTKSSEQLLKTDPVLNQRIRKMQRIRQIQKSNSHGIICQKQRFFMNKQKIVYFHDKTPLNSVKRLQNQLTYLQSLKTITSQQYQQSKFLQYWDYDYKKDVKQEMKLISVVSIMWYRLEPSTLGQTTSTVIIGYRVVNKDKKVQQKELRLIFANPFSTTTGKNANQNNTQRIAISKADELHEWITLVKEI